MAMLLQSKEEPISGDDGKPKSSNDECKAVLFDVEEVTVG